MTEDEIREAMTPDEAMESQVLDALERTWADDDRMFRALEDRLGLNRDDAMRWLTYRAQQNQQMILQQRLDSIVDLLRRAMQGAIYAPTGAIPSLTLE